MAISCSYKNISSLLFWFKKTYEAQFEDMSHEVLEFFS
jgi:hypothetical protein